MKIEWWMLDGLVGLILTVSCLRGIIKGIGDSFLRLVGLAGGLALGVMYSGRVAEWMSTTRISTTLNNHIFELLRPNAEDVVTDGAEQTSNAVTELLYPGQNPYAESMPKTMSGIISDLADKTADVAADKFTSIAISILSFVVIMVGVWIVMALIRALFRTFRKDSILIGFVDRLLGFVLGIIGGTVVACIAIAALIPLTTFFAPAKVPEILTAMKSTYVAGVIYDINPLIMLLRHF